MKRIMMMAAGLLVMYTVQAQPVQWTNSVKKTGNNTYKVHLTATVSAPWQLYSQHTPGSGPVPTVISFSKNPLIVQEGQVMEVGELVRKKEEAFGIDVLYFNNKVDFVQTITTKVKLKTNLAGSVRYMVCNDRECLPPKTVIFNSHFTETYSHAVFSDR